MFLSFPEGPNLDKLSGFGHEIEIFKRDSNEWHFQARLKISSEPSTKPLLYCGEFSSVQASFFVCSRFGPSVKGAGKLAQRAKLSKSIENSGWLRNRTGTGNRNRRNRFACNRKRNRNRRNRLPCNHNRNRNRPFLLTSTETQKNPFCRGTARTENRNRLNRSIPKP